MSNMSQLESKRLTGPSTLEAKLGSGEMFGSSVLKHNVAQGIPLEADAERLRGRYETQVGSIAGRLRRIQAGANLATQRDGSAKFGAGPQGFARQITQAERRGKARMGINQRGEKAILNQQLKDRISIARQGLNRRGLIMDSAQNAAQIRAGGQAAINSAHASTQSAYAGAAGAIAGGALRGFGDKLFDTGNLGQGVIDQQADVDSFFGMSDFGVDSTFGGGFDFAPTNQGAG